MYLKCICGGRYFTEGQYYCVRKYKPGEHYIVIDDERANHEISVAYAVDHFEEVKRCI